MENINSQLNPASHGGRSTNSGEPHVLQEKVNKIDATKLHVELDQPTTSHDAPNTPKFDQVSSSQENRHS